MSPPPFLAQVVVLPTAPEHAMRSGIVVDLPPKSDHARDLWRFVRFFTKHHPRFAWVKTEHLLVTRPPSS